MKSGAALLDERLVSAHPSLIRRLGPVRAIVLQQLNWHVTYTPSDLDGERWYPTTCEALADEIGVSADTIQRAIRGLEDAGLVVSCQPEGRASRRKWYRVDRDALDRPSGDSAASGVPEDRNLPSSEDRDLPGSEDRNLPSSSSSQLPEQEQRLDEPPAVEAEGSPRGDEPAPKAKRARKRDPIWDGLAAAFGDPQAGGEAAHFGKVSRELREIPELRDGEYETVKAEVERRARRARAQWPGGSIASVSKHWTLLGEARLGPMPGRRPEPSQFDRSEPSGEVEL